MTPTRSYLPLSGMDLPRFAGIPTFMRLPHLAVEEAGEVQIGIVGVPWDGGTTNRPGPRHGPRQLRDASTMIRMVNQATGVRPFHLARCADLGDSPVNPADLHDSIRRITGFFEKVHGAGILPMTAGGDHLVSLPVLRAIAKDRPVGMIHFDAHTDFYDKYFGGYTLTHGTPFRRAAEEGLLDTQAGGADRDSGDLLRRRRRRMGEGPRCPDRDDRGADGPGDRRRDGGGARDRW